MNIEEPSGTLDATEEGWFGSAIRGAALLAAGDCVLMVSGMEPANDLLMAVAVAVTVTNNAEVLVASPVWASDRGELSMAVEYFVSSESVFDDNEGHSPRTAGSEMC